MKNRHKYSFRMIISFVLTIALTFSGVSFTSFAGIAGGTGVSGAENGAGAAIDTGIAGAAADSGVSGSAFAAGTMSATGDICAAGDDMAADEMDINLHRDYVVHYSDEPINEGWDSISGKELEKELKNGNIDLFEEDIEVTLFGDSKQQLEHELIGMDTAENLNTLGQGVKVAVIDSGCCPHDELKDNLLPGHNYIDGNDDVSDEQGHGTAVAGIIAAQLDGKGINGVAPKAKIVPLKCFTDSNTRISSVIKAIYDAVDKYDVDIINMSFGTPNSSEGLYEAVKYAKEHDVVMVAAVGNEGDTRYQYPASYSEVIGVGSVTKSGTHVGTSQTNDSVFVTAPGLEIMGPSKNGEFSAFSGTSFSTPIVTGVIADMLSMDSDLYIEDIMAILTSTAIDKGAQGYDMTYGHGIINLDGCIKTMLSDSEMFISPVDVSGDGAMSVELHRLNDSHVNAMLLTEAESIETGKCLGLSAQAVDLTEADAKALQIAVPAALKTDDGIVDKITPCYLREFVLGDKLIKLYASDLDEGVMAAINGEGEDPEDPSDPTISFPDVSETDYYYEPIIWAAKKGITSGYGDGHFAPEMFCTRAQTVTFLWRAAGSPEPSGQNPFKDVIEDDYYYKAVLWAVEKGITKGTARDTFSPDAVVTRGQTVTFLNRASGQPSASEIENPFVDVEEDDYYFEAVMWAVAQKITNGTDEDKFSPSDSCTRGQIVTFLYRASEIE